MKMEKIIEIFVETCIKYLRELYNLKRIVSGKNFDKYNADQTQFDLFFFLKGRYGSNPIVHN